MYINAIKLISIIASIQLGILALIKSLSIKIYSSDSIKFKTHISPQRNLLDIVNIIQEQFCHYTYAGLAISDGAMVSCNLWILA
jgi:hypothetical protein